MAHIFSCVLTLSTPRIPLYTVHAKSEEIYDMVGGGLAL